MKAKTVKESLFGYQTSEKPDMRRLSTNANKLLPEDRVAHDWYRFVLSYPPHLVRDYIQRFGLTQQQHLLDPFCGTGTTLA
jgi:hypothetical protein